MMRPEIDALIQGAIDKTLTPEEQETLQRLIAESSEVRDRAAELHQLTQWLDSLGQTDAPSSLSRDVIARISDPVAHPAPRHVVRVSAPKRGMTVNKKIIFGLAAAAVVVLAAITFYSNQPSTVGTEATIGAAQRAQAPQIASKDVALGDTSAQNLLQSETWDQILKDETLRSMLQDANLRGHLEDAALRHALSDDAAVMAALKSPALLKHLEEMSLLKKLDDAELMKKIDDSNLRAALRNEAFVRAIRRADFRAHLLRAGGLRALSGAAFQQALRDRNFEAALRNPGFAAALARGK